MEKISLVQQQRIRQLNDAFRTSLSGGTICVTDGIKATFANKLDAVLKAVQEFNDFNKENDPYGEHDFGKVVVDGKEIYFKIDYYDPDLEYLSEDPSDPDKTFRVMTIMLASEY